MRVSISGSHSTGKTVLTEECYTALSAMYPGDVDMIGEIAREVIARGFSLNQDATVDSYTNYILLQLEAERNASKKHVVSDRSLVDLVAYIFTNNDPRIPAYFVDMVQEIVQLEVKYFDVYCYLPVEFDLVVDDVRPEEKDYQLAVDRTLFSLFSTYGLDVKTITGTVEERTVKILSLFQST